MSESTSTDEFNAGEESLSNKANLSLVDILHGAKDDHIKLKQNVKEIIEKENLLKSHQILAKKEGLAFAKKLNNEEISMDQVEKEKELVKLREYKDQYHKVLIRSKSIANSLQDAIFESQMQKSVYESLLSNSEVKPEIGSLIEDYHNNLVLSSRLAKAFERTEELSKEIFMKRMKYRCVLSYVEECWRIIRGDNEGKLSAVQRTQDPEIINIREKIAKRRDRLSMLIGMFQGLIACSGESWGSNDRIVQVLIVCDSVSKYLEGSKDLDEDLNSLSMHKTVDF